MSDVHGFYSNLTNVRAELMDDVSTTSVSAAVLLRGAKEAYVLINMKLAKLYGTVVPFALSGATPDTPESIRSIAETLTACWANAHTAGLGTRGRGPSVDECQRAREDIDKLASGELRITSYTPSALPSSNTEDEHPVFFKGDVHDMGQDSDQADRLSDERD